MSGRNQAERHHGLKAEGVRYRLAAHTYAGAVIRAAEGILSTGCCQSESNIPPWILSTEPRLWRKSNASTRAV
jgi:hypothetical protein